MKNAIRLASVLIIMLWSCLMQDHAVNSTELYSITSRSDHGDLTLRARKTYNIWDNGPNRTYYTVSIESQDIRYANQEIRVGLQWVWRDPTTYTGYLTERVIFYGSVKDGRFSQYRLDGGLAYDKSFRIENANFHSNTNADIVALPKTNPTLYEELTSEDRMQYQLVPSNVSEINAYKHEANLTFYVDRDEPQDQYNEVFINWGIFNSPDDSDRNNVYGPTEAYNYMIHSTYGDYFDRPYVTTLYMMMYIGSILGPFSPIIQIFPAALLLLYVLVQPALIQLFIVPSDEMDTENYIWEILLRW